MICDILEKYGFEAILESLGLEEIDMGDKNRGFEIIRQKAMGITLDCL